MGRVETGAESAAEDLSEPDGGRLLRCSEYPARALPAGCRGAGERGGVEKPDSDLGDGADSDGERCRKESGNEGQSENREGPYVTSRVVSFFNICERTSRREMFNVKATVTSVVGKENYDTPWVMEFVVTECKDAGKA